METPTKERVLVVDDEPQVRAALARLIRQQRFEAVLAASAEEALALAESGPFRAVITDVKMPGTDGTELCRLIKSQVHRLVPVVLFSTLPDDDLRVLADRCGADGYLSKSRGFDSLSAQVADLCQSILW